MYRKLEVSLLRDILFLFQSVREVNIKAYREGRGTEEWIRMALEGVEESKQGHWKMVENDSVEEGDESTKVRRMEEASIHVVEDETSGRRVRVMFERGGRVDTDCPGTNWESPGLGRLGMMLRVVRKNEEVREVASKLGTMGFEYDPGEEYWADLRNRRIYEKRGELDRGRDDELPGL